MGNKILDSEVPYVELFGVDGMRRGRPGVDTDAYRLGVGRRLDPVTQADLVKAGVLSVGKGGSRALARRLTGQATRRAMAVLRVLYWKDFVAIYNKEKEHLVAKELSAVSSVSKKGSGGNGS